MQRRNLLFLLLVYLTGMVMGCTPVVISENSNGLPAQTKETALETNNPNPTVPKTKEPTLEAITPRPSVVLQDTPILVTPSVLFEGSTVFRIAINSADNASAAFDFDSNQVLEEQSTNDIKFSMSGGTNIFVTVVPLNGALGFPLDRSDLASETFVYNDCSQSDNEFGQGREPIYPGQFFCWKTNKESLVEFTINDVYTRDGVLHIEVKYIVWSAFE